MPSAGKLSGISTNFNLRAISARREHIHAAFAAQCGRVMKKSMSVVAFAAMLSGFGSAGAQTYPTRPITMVVGFAAGGPTDTGARILAEHIRASLGQPIIIENVVGASGSIGASRVAHGAPDGYLLSFGSVSTHVVNGAIYALPYDVLKDFTPVALVAADPLVIVARKNMAAKDLMELVGWLKANPDKASVGTSGAGSILHLASAVFRKETGTRFQLVPYRGSAPAMQDLVAGQIDVMTDLASSVLPQLHAGAIKAYAAMTKSRMALAPDVPTVDEAGLPGLYVSSWFAVFAPGNTPKSIVATLNAAIVEGLANSSLRERLADLGQQIFPRDQQTPEALAAWQKAEVAKWWPIIKAAGMKGE